MWELAHEIIQPRRTTRIDTKILKKENKRWYSEHEDEGAPIIPTTDTSKLDMSFPSRINYDLLGDDPSLILRLRFSRSEIKSSSSTSETTIFHLQC